MTAQACRDAGLLMLLVIVMNAAGGCASYRPPDVVFAAARLGERTPDATRLDLEFEVANPNDESVELLELHYTVSVSGQAAYRGRHAAQMVLAARRRQMLSVPAVIPADVEGSVAASDAWGIAGELHYTTPGALADILLDTGVRRPKTGFRYRGTVAEWTSTATPAGVREETASHAP
ncbi:MAG: hypothetical protein HKO59_09965 [Phycisphaerales bacterium]|nr:hypothetical protein [Phycisphaerae bacterium]NNF42899.1 hypothetical protein [Phycisphaerales bacterium]NNM26289.1 hypothetical protein [Phycisphaerales bacterium]